MASTAGPAGQTSVEEKEGLGSLSVDVAKKGGEPRVYKVEIENLGTNGDIGIKDFAWTSNAQFALATKKVDVYYTLPSGSAAGTTIVVNGKTYSCVAPASPQPYSCVARDVEVTPYANTTMTVNSDTWVRIGKNMPKKVGDVGFPMVVHPRDADRAWVFPMDGATVWPRVSPDGKPAAYVTKNAGKSWTRQDKGFPRSNAWWTVNRQAMTNDAHEAVGLYVGTTQGEIWASRNEGATWACIARHLPEIYSVEAACFGK